MIYQGIYTRVVYPLYHWALRDGANSAIRELDRNEGMDRGTLERHCETKLRRLVGFAARHVPYYREMIRSTGLDPDAAGFMDDFKRLPLLTKAAINEHRKSMISENLDGNGLDDNSTGGSTGEVLRFYTDRRSGAYRKATVRRNKRWLGILPGDREVRLWGAPLDVAKSRSLRGTLHSWITRERLLSADYLGEETLQTYLEFCEAFRPKLIVAYPSALAEFARFCEARGRTIPSLKTVICSAESLFEHDRREIERAFGVAVFDRYGCREVGDIAHEAPGVDGLLVNSDRILVEVLDEAGNACGAGEQGEVVVTDLDNYGMPLIRYRIGDYARWASDSAHHGSNHPFPVLASVDGRTLDVVRCPGGNRVGGTYWTLLLRSRPGMKRFQVIQQEADSVTVYYELTPGGTPDFDFYRQEIAKTCGADLRVEFTQTDRFVHEPGTKFRLVICNIGDN